MKKKVSMLTGAEGQDSSWLADFLLQKDYKVYAVKRRSSTDNPWRIEHLLNNPDYVLLEGELTDACSINNLIGKIKPDELYNCGAMSMVATSFEQPAYTFDVNARGVIYILEAIRNLSPKTKLYQCSTSEMFGSNYTEENGERFQDERTPYMANSPYALSKLAAHYSIDLYRKSYGLFCCAGIIFNHGGCRRSEEFVTRKVTKWIGELMKWCGNESPPFSLYNFSDEYIHYSGRTFPKLRLGNLDTYRDFSDARDVVRAMWIMLQRDKPEDFVIGSGITRSIREFCSSAFDVVGIQDWEKFVYIDPQFFRPCDVEFLRAKTTKANKELGWYPEISFEQMVKEMVEADIERAKK